MFRKKEILESLLESQKNINENLIKINKSIEDSVKPKFEQLTISADKLGYINNMLESKIYTKEQTVEQINKEYDYRQKYEIYKETNPDLLEMIEKYCKYDNKYKVLELFEEIEKDYLVEKIR